jgi:ABC-type multidrug transport system fused ATPase/permease subunit
MHGRTTFVIAHRWQTIRSADLVAVLEKGQLVGLGTHDELITTCDAYRQLYERQIDPQSAPGRDAPVA